MELKIHLFALFVDDAVLLDENAPWREAPPSENGSGMRIGDLRLIYKGPRSAKPYIHQSSHHHNFNAAGFKEADKLKKKWARLMASPEAQQ